MPYIGAFPAVFDPVAPGEREGFERHQGTILQMRCRGEVFHNTCDLVGLGIKVDFNRLPYQACIPVGSSVENPLRVAFRNDDGMRRFQGSFAVTGHERECENRQKAFVCVNAFFFKNPPVLLQAECAGVCQCGVSLNFAEILGHRRGDGRVGDRAVLDEFALLKTIVGNAVNAVEIFIEPVEAQLETHILQDHQAGSNAGYQPGNVHGRKTLVLPHIAQGDFEVIPDHANLK